MHIPEYAFWASLNDKNLLEEQKSPILEAAIEDLQKAINTPGFIPDQYLNQRDLTDILNVVLQGVNNTDNQEIYDIGIKIVKDISGNYQSNTGANSRDPAPE